MLNDFRTRLANLSPAGRRDYEPAVTASFVPRTLDKAEKTIRDLLFGQKPDRQYATYRSRELMQLVLSSGLADLVTARDSRLAEDFDTPLFPSSWFVPKTVPVGVTIGKTTWLGESRTDDVLGISATSGTVLYTGSQLLLTLARPSFSKTTVSSDIVAIGNTGYRLLVQGASPGEQWTMTVNQKPMRSLGKVLATIDASFGTAVVELVARCGPLSQRLGEHWQNREETNERLATVACCLALAVEP